MNWVDICKTLEIVRNNLFNDIYVTEESTTYTAPKNGYYKIICVGEGGNARTLLSNNIYTCKSGAGGGVATKIKRLSKNSALSITISNGTASCDGMVAHGGGDAPITGSNVTTGGTATGGDENYKGFDGEISRGSSTSATGGGVGCLLNGITMRDTSAIPGPDKANSSSITIYSGFGILGHGGGAGCGGIYDSNTYLPNIVMDAQPAGVLIIPMASL